MPNVKELIIAVDFDGTLVDHRFPDIGAPVPGAFESLKELQRRGHRLILWTMRSDQRADGEVLTAAIEFCRAQGVVFWAVNENPEQSRWTKSPKVFAHLYVDDMAVGCPLRENPRSGGRPFVDWDAVMKAIGLRDKTTG